MRSLHVITLCFTLAAVVGVCCVHQTTYIAPSPTGGKVVFCGELPPHPTGVHLPIPHQKQERSRWCWLTVIAMLTHYYGAPVEACGLASERIGSDLNCCETATTTGSSRCNQGGYDWDMETALARANLYYRHKKSALQEWELIRELSNGRPVFIVLANKTGSHMMLIGGFSRVDKGPVIYDIFDTNLETGTIEQATFNDLVGGTYKRFNGRWKETWFRLSQRSDGCNPTFDPSCGCSEKTTTATRSAP